MPQLIFNIEKEYPLFRDLVPEKNSIGRNHDNVIVLKESSVSDYHAELTLDESGACCLENLSLQDSTTVNSERIKEKVPLKDGDRIRFGSVKAVFVANSGKNKEQGLKNLIRKDEIERNNLRLLENDSNWLRSEIEKSTKLKEALEGELEKLSKVFDATKADLSENRKEAERLADVVVKAKSFEAEFNDVEIKFNSRKNAFEELGRKIAAGEKRLGELDLDNAIQQKEQVNKDLERLVEEMEKSKAGLEENRRASGEAASILEKAKVIEAGIGELEATLESRKNQCEELELKIADREKAYRELDLENSIKQKEELTLALNCLSNEIGASRTELEENSRASGEATSILEKAKLIEAGIGELAATLKSRRNESEELEMKIADREKTFEELVGKISDGNGTLEVLTNLIESKQKGFDDLSTAMAKNEDLFRSSGDRLTEVESRIGKCLEDISRSRETHNSLEKESTALNRIISEKSAVLERLKVKINPSGKAKSVCPPLRLINPGMSSLIHYFHHGSGIPGEERFDPIGFPAFAACTKGSMHRAADSIMSGDAHPVLLQLTGALEKDRSLIESVSPEKILLVCWGEGRFKTLMDQEGPDLTELLSGVSGIVSIDQGTAKLLEKSNPGPPHIHLPIPCPVEFPDWNLSVPIPDRTRGVFVCGDGFDPNLQAHRTRIEFLNRLAADTKTAVTLYRREHAAIDGLNISDEQLYICDSSQKYSDYLRLVGQHYLVAGFGKNGFGGEITADAALGRAILIGGDGENSADLLLFPDTCLNGDNFENALENSTRLLSDNDVFLEAMEASQNMANQLISFDSVRDRLGEFIHLISGSSPV